MSIPVGWIWTSMRWDCRQTSRFKCMDLLTEAYYIWQGPRNYVQLDPAFGAGPYLSHPA